MAADEVRDILRLPASEDVDRRTLHELGARSVRAVALQFRMLRETSANVGSAEPVGGSPVANLAALIGERRTW